LRFINTNWAEDRGSQSATGSLPRPNMRRDPLPWRSIDADYVWRGSVRDRSRLLEEPVIDVRAVTLLPPVARPPKIISVGLNYEDHLNEVGLKRPEYPEIFARFATSLIGHGAVIARPPESNKLDYEAELAVVIGLGGRRIAKDAALDHIAGYSIFNDATLRDYQIRTPQWTVGKNFDRTGPLGRCCPPDLEGPLTLNMVLSGHRCARKRPQHPVSQSMTE
jgi:2-keto-4-pentenoate hydratase/2-oxohepta-3-ene-1,7-dioic acid hydratase in catechol pathway